MAEGTSQCQVAINTLSHIQDSLKHVLGLRQQYGPGLFSETGGSWVGSDARGFMTTLATLVDEEGRLASQGDNLIVDLHDLLSRLQQLDV